MENQFNHVHDEVQIKATGVCLCWSKKSVDMSNHFVKSFRNMLIRIHKVGPGGYWTKCYYIKDTLRHMNQTDARRFCEGMGGNLLTIRDEHEREYIHEHLLDDMGAVWLGVERFGPLRGESYNLMMITIKFVAIRHNITF